MKYLFLLVFIACQQPKQPATIDLVKEATENSTRLYKESAQYYDEAAYYIKMDKHKSAAYKRMGDEYKLKGDSARKVLDSLIASMPRRQE